MATSSEQGVGTASDENHYDLIVIGSGPGGQRAAVQAAKLKKRTLLIERDQIGGACLHLGTIPSKTLREAAMSSQGHRANALSLVMAHKQIIIDKEASVIGQQMRRNGVEFATGTAEFTSPRTVQIDGGGSDSTMAKRVVSADYFVIATGTRPLRPANIPFDDKTVFDSDTILGIDTLPRRLAVIGAGVIGCEYASIFAKLGVRVTLIERRLALLRAMDAEVVSILQEHFLDANIDLKMGTQFGAISPTVERDRPAVTVQIGPANEIFKFDAVLYCMGRIGNVEALKLEAAGIAIDERRLLTVNTHYQTSVPHIYAVGDVVGAPGLAASSAEQGRLAATHAFGIEGGSFPETFPFGVYTIPEISSVGAHEEQVEQSNVPYVVGRARYRELARGKILGDDTGLLKLIVNQKTRKLLGVHIIGTGATELIHIGQVALALGAEVDFFVSNVFNYPTLAEAYKVAAYHAFNQLRDLE